MDVQNPCENMQLTEHFLRTRRRDVDVVLSLGVTATALVI